MVCVQKISRRDRAASQSGRLLDPWPFSGVSIDFRRRTCTLRRAIPRLGPAFALIERMPASVTGLSHIHCFNAGSTMSHAALAGNIPGLTFGATAFASSPFVASAGALQWALRARDNRELEATRYSCRAKPSPLLERFLAPLSDGRQ